MRNWRIFRIVFLFLILLSQSIFCQIIGIDYSDKLLTNYTDGNSNDTIYIWNSNKLDARNAKFKVIPKSGVAPYTFEWFYHNENTFSWKKFQVDQGNSSQVENLPSDGYRVQIKDSTGKLVECHTAWAWNINIESNANVNVVNCSNVNLTAQVDAEANFVYYNLPPPESIITAKTKIKVEFNAVHTYVSDLAFYLVGPESCGSPRILLSPNPGALNLDKHICNSGDNVNSLTFSNTSKQVLDICASAAPLAGEYGTYSLDGIDYPIDWSPLIGCNAAQGGWSVQIYDCIYLDVGYLDSASITFSDLESVCGSQTSISYNSGQIKSAIRDKSCSAETASIFQVHPHLKLRTPIVLNANVDVAWYQNDIKLSSTLDHKISNVVQGSYSYDFKTIVSLGTTRIQEKIISKDIIINQTSPILVEKQLFCKSLNPKISDLKTNGQNLKWYLGEFDTNALNLNTYLRSGFYYASQVVNGCESNRKKIEVTIVETIAPVTSNQFLCSSNAKVSELIAQGQNLKWYLFASGGEPLTLDANVIEGTYYVTQTVNGCESVVRTRVEVKLLKTPKPKVINNNFCFDKQSKIKDLQVVGTNIKFYENEVGGFYLNEETILSTGSYYASQTIDGCESDREIIYVKVFPTLNFTPLNNQTICSGNILDLKLPTSTDSVTYQWEVVSNKVNGATKGSGSSITQKLWAISDEIGTVTYSITPIVNGCVGNLIELEVKVNPIPKIKIEIENNILCSGDITRIKLSSNINNTTFRWSAISNNVVGATAGNGDIISQSLTTIENNANVIYKITPYLGDCQGETIEVEVIVHKLPELNLEDGFLCYDVQTRKIVQPYIIDSKLTNSNYNFEWFFDGNLIANENKPQYSAFKKGNYTLKVSDNSNCVVSKTVYISENKSVESATYVLSNYFKDAQTITVTVNGTGDYLYQLNDESPQKSNVFAHVLPGIHRIVITDVFDCTYIVFEQIITVHYPNFFTPNGDGINDLWNIWSLKEKGQADILIFDRFGKLIKQISPQSDGWDGTIDGAILPSTDYWFVVNYIENGMSKTFKSHFSLKR